MPDKININYDNGEVKEADLLCYLKVENLGNIVMYTFNETDANQLVKIHAAKVTEENGEYRFNKIDNEDEWARVKNIMREMIAGGAN